VNDVLYLGGRINQKAMKEADLKNPVYIGIRAFLFVHTVCVSGFVHRCAWAVVTVPPLFVRIDCSSSGTAKLPPLLDFYALIVPETRMKINREFDFHANPGIYKGMKIKIHKSFLE
jgi:hypothetical protein